MGAWHRPSRLGPGDGDGAVVREATMGTGSQQRVPESAGRKPEEPLWAVCTSKALGGGCGGSTQEPLGSRGFHSKEQRRSLCWREMDEEKLQFLMLW